MRPPKTAEGVVSPVTAASPGCYITGALPGA